MAYNKIVLFICLAVTNVIAEYSGSHAALSPAYGVPSLEEGYPAAGPPSYGGGNGGEHESFDHHDEHHEAKPYEFGYAVKDHHTGTDFGQHESSDGHNVKGQYRVLLPDGRTQIVTYMADWKTGFHADVKYEGEAHYPEHYPSNHAHNGGSSGEVAGYPEHSGSFGGY